MLRFYKGAVTLEDIKYISFVRLKALLSEINNVVKLETGETEERPLEGDVGFAVAKKLFRVKKEK